MIIDKNTAPALACTPRTGSTTIFVNTSNTLSLKTAGNRVVEMAGALPVAKPTIVDPYNSATGYTFSASVASATSVLSDKEYGNVNITSSLAGTTTMFVDKNTTTSFVPSRMGVIAARIGVWGKTAGRVMTMRDGLGSNSNNVILADNATSPLVRKGHMWLAYDVSDFPAFAALTAPQVINPRFGVQLTGNDGITTANLGPYVCNAPGRTKVTITFDDVYARQYSLAFPLFKARNLPASVYVVPNNIGQTNRLTLSQLQEMAAAGWAMCSNGTPDDTVVSTTIAAALQGLNTVRDYIRSNNLSIDGSENHGCWPGDGSGLNWDEARCAAFEAAGMLTMRSTTGWNVYDEFGLEDIAMTLPSFSGGQNGIGSSAATALAAVDLAIKRKSSIHIHLHDVVESGATTSAINVAVLTEFLDGLATRVSANQCDVVNRTDYWKAVANNKLPDNLEGLSSKTASVAANQLSVNETTGALVVAGKERSFTQRITWAELQLITPATQIGRTYFVTDIGVNGSVWIGTSVEWAPVGPVMLYSNRTDRTATNTVTTQQILDTYELPANILGTTRSLEINSLWSFTGSVSTKSIVSSFGASSAVARNALATTVTYAAPQGLVIPRNNSALLQSFPNANANYPATASGTLNTGSVNTTAPVQINTSVTFAATGGADVATLRSVEIYLRG